MPAIDRWTRILDDLRDSGFVDSCESILMALAVMSGAAPDFRRCALCGTLGCRAGCVRPAAPRKEGGP